MRRDAGPSEGEDEQTALNAAPPAIVRTYPRVVWSDARGSHEALVQERTVIGSSSSAGIVVADRSVSRMHAELEPTARGTWIRDLESRNGTLVEGLQVTAARLPDGARVRVGSTELRVRYASDPAPVELWAGSRFGGLVGASVAMRELFAQLARVAPTGSSVLVRGETGTGKELVARAIHDASPRSTSPFVVVDCAALPENLLESELFGHARGAFTGASSAREGAFEAANGGTVFLDEIGELPLAMQPKLLRVLESRTVRRLGENSHRAVDVRLVSATHRDLRTMVNNGAFREDLYFRLAVLPITIPPLRERTDDIALLVEHFARGSGVPLDPELLRQLSAAPWLGNVRELRNFVERLAAFGTDRALALGARNEPLPSAGPRPSAPSPSPPPPPAEASPSIDYGASFKDFRERWVDLGEREYIRRLLERHGRNVSAAAAAAGVDRTYIYRLIRKHGL